MDKPIGVIDSGIGGLTVAKEIVRQLPKERMIYIGDTARCPYGPRAVEEVRRFTWQMIQHLLEEDIKMLVIACNTATAVALEEVQAQLSIPVVGVVQPGALAALNVTQTNEIAIIGTEGTVKSNAYPRALKAIQGSQVIVHSLACPTFVPLVEQGMLTEEDAYFVVKDTLQPLIGQSFDTLILGCTHYPLLTPVIQKVVGTSVQVISSGAETAREVSTILHHQGINQNVGLTEAHKFYITGSIHQFQMIAKRWLGIGGQKIEELTFTP
ncbi:glutamate racemase [Geomicrobium halophilum]|uniref:Glutamate racemase n=1 Tax=Geomicrobium halophilum TaxID=549000 RepID=A0A841PHP3_9BACL|nr:glutamate racemase [Geomicrobium halophilum]MBB6448310.1 glutamate racemase [Geomicrobium halophilum]